MPHRVFILHGMGNQANDWAKEEINILTNFYKKEKKSSTPNFDNAFKFIPINFGHIFKNAVDQWQERAQELNTLSNLVGAGYVSRLTDWLDGAGDEEDFFWSHAVDVILYRFSGYFRETVVTNVAAQIFSEFDISGRDDNWSIIGHSLGTSIVHDTIHRWYTQGLRVNGAPLHKLGHHLRPRSIIMISNVSRVLQTDPKVMHTDSMVRPGKACLYYTDINNKYDPFSRLRPFDSIVWPNKRNAQKFKSTPVDHIFDKNNHGLSHYLKNPLVCESIFNTLLESERLIKPQTLSELDRIGNLPEEVAVKIKETLESLNTEFQQVTKLNKDIWTLFPEFNNKYLKTILN